MKRILEIFISPDGDLSSKRFLAVLLILSGVVYIFLNYFSPQSDKENWKYAAILIDSGLLLLGVQAITRT